MQLQTSDRKATSEGPSDIPSGVPATRRERFTQLIEQLRTGSDAEQVEAARILWRFGAPALDPLIGALRSNAEPAATAAVEALGKIADPRAVQPLVDAVVARYDARVLRNRRLLRMAEGVAVFALLFLFTLCSSRWFGPGVGVIGLPLSPVAVRWFLPPLPELAREALTALSRIAERQGLSELARRLHDAGQKARRGPLRSASFFELLQETAARLGSKPTATRVSNFEDVGGCRRDSEPLGSLLEALQDRSSEVRTAAAEALGQLEDSRAIDGLQAALRRNLTRGSGRWERSTGILAVVAMVGVAGLSGLLGRILHDAPLAGSVCFGLAAVILGIVCYLQQKREGGAEVRAIVESLAWIGEQTRQPELRELLADLRAAAKDRVQQDPATRLALRSAATRIERVTTDLHRLPVSSSAPESEWSYRPLPSDSQLWAAGAELPRPVEERHG